MDEKPKTEEKIDKPVVKSWDQLKKEAKTQQKEKIAKKLNLEVKEEKAETPEPTKTEEVKEEPKVEEKKLEEPKIDVNEVAAKAARQAAEEAANRVAAQAKTDKAEFQAKLDQILNKDADMQQKQKDADELIAAWDKENRLPKDYKEYIAEGLRINEARWNQLDREKAKVQEEKPIEPITPNIDENQQKLKSFQDEIVNDLADIYSAKFLPKPADLAEINNPNTTDPSAKETQKLLAFGVKLNTERVSNGLEPIKSLNKIYFLHYKPVMDKTAPKNDQPAGADAPVSPSRNQSVTDQSAPRPFYQKGEDGHYHPKSWAQIKYEQLKARVGR